MEKKKEEDESGWTVVDKKSKKAIGTSKEEAKKAKQELNAYLGEF